MTPACVGRPDLHLHPSRAVPLYYSLALAFESAIDNGQISVGDTLESVATLHSRLKLSPGTIRRAMRLLEERGIVTCTARTKFRVVASPDPGSDKSLQAKDFS